MTTATSLQPGTLLQQRETYLSILKDLTIMDDIFMRNVLKDSACTEYILKVIMNQDDLKLEDQILQADYKNLQGRSSTLDCVALDKSGRKYNIEFQNADSGASLKRARYHGSLVDANTLKTGQVPNELPDTYIIFITENDTLGCNLPIYHINRTIEENCQRCHDQLHIIYVNSSQKMILLDSIYQSVTLIEHLKKLGSLVLINYTSSMSIHHFRMILLSADLCTTCIALILMICIAKFWRNG